MSFGWSAGDIVAAITVLFQAGQALRDVGGASSDYQESSLFLDALATTLDKISTTSNLESLQADVDAVRKPVTAFVNKIQKRFEKGLGPQNEKGWKRFLDGPRKIEYAFFVNPEVKELRSRIATPLNTIQLRLGLGIFEVVSNLQTSLSGLPAEVTKHVTDIVAKAADEIMKKYLENTKKTNEDIIQEISTLLDKDKKVDGDILQRISAWLRPVDVESDRDKFQTGLHPGTCQWIFDKPEYTQWVSEPADKQQPLLWISGIPGAGKSNLATSVIDRLCESHHLAYFYCKTTDEHKKTVLDILRTWVWQLLQQAQELPGELVTVYRQGEEPRVSNMRKCLRILLQNEKNTRLVLDGLDECEERVREELFSTLPDILRLASVAVFSRQERDIAQALQKCGRPKGLLHFHINEDDNGIDITNYLDNAVKELDLEDDRLEEHISITLQRNCNGMFLWANLMINSLSEPGLSIEQYEEKLYSMPRDLDSVYSRTLETLYAKEDTRDRSRQMFQWLTCSRRPLTIAELGAALAITPGERKFDPRSQILRIKQGIRQWCSSLVIVDENSGMDGTVTLAHASVKDFLLSNSCSTQIFAPLLVSISKTQQMLSTHCLTCLNYENIEFHSDHTADESAYLNNLEMHLQKNPFLSYAAANWWLHYESCIPGTETIALLRDLISSARTTAKWLQVYHYLNRKYGNLTDFSGFLEWHSKKHLLTDEDGSQFRTWTAHFTSHTRFVRWRRFTHQILRSPFMDLQLIHIAAYYDFHKLIEEESSRGVSVELKTSCGMTPLFLAAYGDSLASARLLLDRGVSWKSRGFRGETPFHCAVHSLPQPESGPFPVATILLEVGADSYLRDEDGRTPLNMACRIPLTDDPYVLELVGRMLERKSDDINWGRDSPPLHGACTHNSVELAKLLLKNGARVDAGFGNYHTENKLNTPLVWAVTKQSPVASTLLEAGADVQAKDFEGRTCLHWAVWSGSDISKILIDRGAKVNAIAHFDGSLPIHYAVRENHMAQVKQLIEHKSYLDVRDGSGQTPLDIAINNGSTGIIDMLLNAGADADCEDRTVIRDSGKILIKNKDRPYWPQKSRDVCEVIWILRRFLGQDSRQPAILAHILSFSEYWLKTTVARSEFAVYNEKSTGPAYVQSQPILGHSRRPVQKVAFTMTSHDQGFSDHTAFVGSYAHSWTGFRVRVVKADGRPLDVDDNGIQVNVHGSTVWRTHIVVYGYGRHVQKRNWLDQLESGDSIQVVPWAQWPGWTNYVRRIQIDVYTL